MKILSIGAYFAHDTVDDAEFPDETSALDYDVLIWDPNRVVGEYRSSFGSNYRGRPTLNGNDSARILADLSRRQQEIKELLKMGRSVVIITPKPELIFVDSGRSVTSGTGRNARTTTYVDELNLLDYLPVQVETVMATGKSIDFRGGEPFAAFWNANKKYLIYRSYFQNIVGTPIFFIKGTDKVVGTYQSIDNGNLLFIPDFEASDEEYDEASSRFIDSLVSLIGELRKSTGEFDLPAWSTAYVLPQEDEQKMILANLESELSNVLAKISKQKEEILKLEEFKILFTGSGRALEVQTKKVFEELGFTVSEGAPGRDDLILRYGEKVAVVEVKGVSKSAAEKHAAQLEKWVSEFYSTEGVKPKGILLVNAFKDTPLLERTESVFPNQMIKYSTSREHCLISGIQLLGLFMDILYNNGNKEEIIDKIFSTDGIFPDYHDWSTVLKVIEVQIEGE